MKHRTCNWNFESSVVMFHCFSLLPATASYPSGLLLLIFFFFILLHTKLNFEIYIMIKFHHFHNLANKAEIKNVRTIFYSLKRYEKKLPIRIEIKTYCK